MDKFIERAGKENCKSPVKELSKKLSGKGSERIPPQKLLP
jgi:hypothetical protein